MMSVMPKNLIESPGVHCEQTGAFLCSITENAYRAEMAAVGRNNHAPVGHQHP